MNPFPEQSPRRGLGRWWLAIVAAVVGLALVSVGAVVTWPASAGMWAALSDDADGSGSPSAKAPKRLLPAVTPTTTGAYAFNSTLPSGRPLTFDPCKPIRWELNPAGMPEGAEPILQEVVADVSTRTGLKFEYVGVTAREPDPDATPPDATPVLVSWSDRVATPELAGDVIGSTTPVDYGWEDDAESYRFSTGTIVFDAEDMQQESPDEMRVTIQTQFGFLVGLDYVDDPGELMVEFRENQDGWGPGDLQGLALAGQGACVPE